MHDGIGLYAVWQIDKFCFGDIHTLVITIPHTGVSLKSLKTLHVTLVITGKGLHFFVEINAYIVFGLRNKGYIESLVVSGIALAVDVNVYVVFLCLCVNACNIYDTILTDSSTADGIQYDDKSAFLHGIGKKKRRVGIMGLYCRKPFPLTRYDVIGIVVITIGCYVFNASDDILQFCTALYNIAFNINQYRTLITGKVNGIDIGFKVFKNGAVKLNIDSREIVVVAVGAVAVHFKAVDNQALQQAVLLVDVLVWVNDPSINIAEIAVVFFGGVVTGLTVFLDEVAVNRELHSR